MKILITAGGTREDIDSVRGITNYSTGRLGSFIGDQFIQGGDQVTYICSETAALPNASPSLEVITIRNVAQLQERLEQALYTDRYDCVIHSMAVSDYAPYATASLGGLSVDESSVDESFINECSMGKLSVQLRDLSLTKLSEGKISSDSPFLVMVLKRQPKIIQRIKEIQPDTLLIGFKLLSGEDETALAQAADKLMAQSHADYVLANDLSNINGDVHQGMLFSRDGVIGSGNSKYEIAQMIYNLVKNRKVTGYMVAKDEDVK